MFQLHESYIYVPLYCPGCTSLYESIWSRCYLYFMQITSIYPSMILVLIPLWLDAVYILHLCSTHIWFGCTFLYGRDAVYISWKINLCTHICLGAHPHIVGMIFIFHEKYVFMLINGLGAHLYMVGMMYIFHEKYISAPIYGLGAHPYVFEILFIFHDIYVFVPLDGLGAHPFMVGLLFIFLQKYTYIYVPIL